VSILLYRIDDRLIHGQVVVGWGQPLEIGFIVLVDDQVAASDWEQELYCMGVPPGMQIYFNTTDAAIKAIPGYVADSRPGILLTSDIATMHTLVDAGVIESVNVGGLHHRAGRTQKLRYVFLTPEEEKELSAIGATGVPVFAQDVPGATKVELPAILEGGQ
jgi:PTS system mannose-specific IIB component/fructoselysine and glucoselysine-specific PTS system IIB component